MCATGVDSKEIRCKSNFFDLDGRIDDVIGWIDDLDRWMDNNLEVPLRRTQALALLGPCILGPLRRKLTAEPNTGTTEHTTDVHLLIDRLAFMMAPPFSL